MTEWVVSHAWMTPAVFAQGGALELATDRLREMHGTRALSIWQRGLTDYARGRAITESVREAFIRESLEHNAMYRAACYASVELRLAPTAAHKTNNNTANRGVRALTMRPRAVPMTGWRA